MTYEQMRPGCYDPRARLEDMDRDGVIASLGFPTFPGFCGGTFCWAEDRALALRCVQAYNDWLLEEWCAAAPGRFIPLVILPLWDPARAAEEIGRCAARGARAIAFPENPTGLGLPSIHSRDAFWHPVLSLASELRMPLCLHMGSSAARQLVTSDDAPLLVGGAWQSGVLPSGAMLDWLFSGHFRRYPGLQVVLSEGHIGWIPYFLQRAQQVWDKQRFWAARADYVIEASTGRLERRDSPPEADHLLDLSLEDTFRQHVYGCFIEDAVGVRNLDWIGAENVMIETDYPHTDSTWPNSRETARSQLAGRSDREIHQILQGNARRVFSFEPAAPPEPPDRASEESRG